MKSAEQWLNEPRSLWYPWTPEYRYERNLMEEITEDDTPIAEITENSLQIRSLMVDIVRNFHTLDTLKVKI